MGFVLTTGHDALRTASESDLHWQANSLLAYGAQGLWYYNYRIQSGGSYEEALVTHQTGTPTRNYDYVRRLNEGILAQGPLLMRLRSIGVYHCHGQASERPLLTQPWRDGVIPGVRELNANKVLVGVFEVPNDDPKPVCCYLMFVNKRHGADSDTHDVSHQTVVTLRLDPGCALERLDHPTGQPIELKPAGTEYELSLHAGGRALLRLTGNRSPVKENLR
jgi:hypothetical protein